MWFAASLSFNGSSRGIPPPTLASKQILTLLSFAVFKISSQCFASKALFAVTTCFPWFIAFKMNVFAGS